MLPGVLLHKYSFSALFQLLLQLSVRLPAYGRILRASQLRLTQSDLEYPDHLDSASGGTLKFAKLMASSRDILVKRIVFYVITKPGCVFTRLKITCNTYARVTSWRNKSIKHHRYSRGSKPYS